MAKFWDRKEKPFVLVVFLLPLAWMVYSLLTGRYFPDPAEPLMTLSGIWASVAMVGVLLITPIVKNTNFKFLNRYRRFVGLSAFFYALLHLLIYLVFHAGLSWQWIIQDVLQRPYIYIGLFAFVILLLLAMTSTKKMMKRLGVNWKKLHQYVYFAALAIVAHLWWQVKSDITIALWVTAFLAPLLLMRIKQFPLLKNFFTKS
ncbi:sulfite oxidase heme-binding subunit YedZ [Marinomonas dokdonensis]|uniref:sulfite oxidase heme-binding subunit YedZ n=1 Tax=Marinomonas dokdonensis TaxID=328224 RepID=UPI0040558BD7